MSECSPKILALIMVGLLVVGQAFPNPRSADAQTQTLASRSGTPVTFYSSNV